MRTLNRNTRKVTYERVSSTVPILDEYGNETLEVRTEYAPPITTSWNVSAAVGEAATRVFGDLTDYSRTVALCGECPVSEGDRVTFEGQIYKIVKIADSKNAHLLALREVAGDG